MIRPDTDDGLFTAGNPATGQKGTSITAEWLNALLEEVIGHGGDTITAALETTLTETNLILFANPPDGFTISYHLPVYASVGALKRYKVKNIGQGLAQLDAIDAKLIDGESTMLMVPGDRCELAKDGTNWQTI